MIGFKETKDTFINSIFAKSLAALYKLNQGKDGRSKVALIDSIYQGLVIGKEGLELSKLEMALDTATDEWLDYWGYILAVPRLENEPDDKYRDRMIWEIIYPKNTLDGIKGRIERYIKDRRGEDAPVRIFEPWTKLLKTDDIGKLDGEERLVSYEYWNYGYIDITLPDTGYLTPDLIDYLKRIKAAGVQLVFSFSPAYEIIGSDETEKERRKHAVWFKDLRSTEMMAMDDKGIFRTAEGKETDSLLDKKDVLLGRPSVIDGGVIIERVEYATGVIRNHLGSAVLNLTDYEYLENKEGMTVKEGLDLEKESFDGTRLEEGRLTRLQASIDINQQNYIYTIGLVSYGDSGKVGQIITKETVQKVKEENKPFIVDENILDGDKPIQGRLEADLKIKSSHRNKAKYINTDPKAKNLKDYRNVAEDKNEIMKLSTDGNLLFREDIDVLDGETKLEGKEIILFGFIREEI